MAAICPPPESIYASYDEAYHALSIHGKEHGYGFRLKRSLPHKTNVKTRYYYICDRAGNYESKAKKLSTSTRALGCPFRLVIFKTKDGQWQLQVNDAHHNHPPSLNPAAHNVYRKRTPAQKDTIELMTHAGARPMQIMAALQKGDPDTFVSASDVRGERKTLRQKELDGRSPIEALLDELSTPEWVFSISKDADNRVQKLFFAHTKQVQLLLANPDVLLMDCTYRTNRYRLPLLHIIGCTNLQTFFSAGFCFLSNETQEDYYWAISTFLLKTGVSQPRVFISDQEEALKLAARELLSGVPQLLCVWHINKNVQTRAQQTWRDADGETREQKEEIRTKRAGFMKRWTELVYAKRQLEFQQKWDKLLKDYSDQRGLCEYLRENQWQTRTEWVAAWTSQHRHYNTITTSPVEGMHKVLKDYLMTSRGDLLRVVSRIEQMVQSQFNKYTKELASAKHSVKFKHKLELTPFLPREVLDNLTPPALELLKQQQELHQKEQKRYRGHSGHPCTGLFEKTNGLPCRHSTQRAASSGLRLALSIDIDDHWRYERLQGPSIHTSSRPHQTVLEPLVAQTRGAPRRNEASTRRDPSAFERRVPRSTQSSQIQIQSQGGDTLTSVLHGLTRDLADAAVTMASSPAAATALITASASLSIPAPVSPPPLAQLAETIDPALLTIARSSSPQGSQGSQVSISLSIDRRTPTPSPSPLRSSPPDIPDSPLRGQGPTLEEFLADLERRRHQRPLGACTNPDQLVRYMVDTGQQKNSIELIEARNMALATTGIYASCTPTMAWNLHFGDKEAYYAERFAQLDAQNDVSRRPKRAAAIVAPEAWKGLSPRKRQRR